MLIPANGLPGWLAKKTLWQEGGCKSMKIVEKIDKNSLPSIVKSIGVEVECGCYKKHLHEILLSFPNVKIGEDGSVNVEPVDDNIEDVWKRNVEIKFWSDNLDDLFRFLDYCWNKAGIVQNETCGNHVHVRFHNFVPFWFSPFPYYFLRKYRNRYAKNKKYMLRLKNSYCRSYRYDNEKIVRMLNGDCESSERYKFINYLSYPKHGTIEFRVMPHADSAEEHKMQVLFILDVIEKWIGYDRKLYESDFFLPGQEYVRKEEEIIVLEGGDKYEI